MLHHISLPAHNPKHVAEVLSELWNGRAFPFPPSPNSYVVFASDSDRGICLEVYPIGTELVPCDGDKSSVQVRLNRNPAQFCEMHAALSVPLHWEQIRAIAERENWQAMVSDRGSGCYQIVELWLENRFLLELLTPEMVEQYSAFMTPQNWERYFDLELMFDASEKSFRYRSRLPQFKV